MLAVSEHVDSDATNLHHVFLYNINDDRLSIIDSTEITQFRSDYIAAIMSNDYITNEGINTYFFYTDYSTNTLVFDTLYFINKQLNAIPYLKLNFRNNGFSFDGEKEIYVFNIYKSSRFVFAHYRNKGVYNYFCYDTKSGKGYNMTNYIDDIHTNKKV